MGGGNNTLSISGGSASIVGNINGGVGGTNAMTVDPGTSNSFSYSGSISNFNSVTISSGTVTFTGSNSYTGQTIVNGGKLVAGAGNRINDGAAFTLNGGTLDTAGLSETVGTLLLSSSSIIDLGSGSSVLNLADSSSLSGNWSGTLSVFDWTGNLSGGGLDQLFFGNSASGLTNGQLSAINFYSGAGTGFLGTGAILSDGEVVPLTAVPEPSTVAAGILVSIAMLGHLRRRRAS
jgi:autotransporter-associated beta strand protein